MYGTYFHEFFFRLYLYAVYSTRMNASLVGYSAEKLHIPNIVYRLSLHA